MYLVPPRGRGGCKASAGFCSVQFRGSALYTDCVGPPALLRYLNSLRYLNWTAATNLQQGTCEPGPTALLPMGLAYVTTAYTYGRPMQARTNNVSITVYYENGSSNLTAEGYCPHLHLSLPRWQGIFARRSGVLATLVSFLSLVWQ